MTGSVVYLERGTWVSALVPDGRSAMRDWIVFLRRVRKIAENRLLASSFQSFSLAVRLRAWGNLVPSGRIVMKFEYFSKISRENSSFIKFGEE